MTYDKEKSLNIIDKLKDMHQESVNFCDAAEDLRNALNLGYTCYDYHLSSWSDLSEHADNDTKEYWTSLFEINEALKEAGVFYEDEIV